MPNNRTIQISLDHMVAEMVAFPLASASAQRQRVYELDPRVRAPATQRLWRDAEVEFTSHFPHTCIDELVSLRNLLWFGQAAKRADEPISIADYLRRIADEFLAARGTSAIPELPQALHDRGGIASGDAPDPTARRAWRWLTFALPPTCCSPG